MVVSRFGLWCLSLSSAVRFSSLLDLIVAASVGRFLIHTFAVVMLSVVLHSLT